MGGLALGTTQPDLFSYRLDVDGNSRVRNDSYINRDLWVDRNLDVDGTSNFLGNITASSSLGVSGNLFAYGNASVTGNLTVDGGKGIIRGPSSTQQAIAFSQGAVSFPNAPAGAVYDAQFAIPANQFSSNPRVCIAQLTNHSGTFERWTYTVVNVDYLNNSFWVRFYNASNQSSTAAFTLNFILVGPAL